MDALNNVLLLGFATAVLVGAYLSYRQEKKYDDEIERQRKLLQRPAKHFAVSTQQTLAWNEATDKGVPMGPPFFMYSSGGVANLP